MSTMGGRRLLSLSVPEVKPVRRYALLGSVADRVDEGSHERAREVLALKALLDGFGAKVVEREGGSRF